MAKYKVARGEPICRATAPPPKEFICTRVKGHDGEHEATGLRDRTIKLWED